MAYPQNAGDAIRTLFVGANYKQGKQSGRHDSNMRPLGYEPSELSTALICAANILQYFKLK